MFENKQRSQKTISDTQAVPALNTIGFDYLMPAFNKLNLSL